MISSRFYLSTTLHINILRAHVESYDASTFITINTVLNQLNILPQNASCLFVLMVSYKMQDNCKHLFMFMWPVCRAALGKCLREHLCKHAHPRGGHPRGG